MTYASIMVHAAASAEAEPRLRLAASLAETFDALLIGVGAEIIYPITVGAFGETMVVAGDEAVEADLKAAEAAFRAASTKVRRGVEWRAASDFPDSMVAREARAADLIVAGPEGGMSAGLYSEASPGELLMQCGRPILVAPSHLTSLDLDNVLVAWKDTREARRAVSDALPFLKRAKHVLLLEICEHADGEDDAKQRLADVAAALERHGVRASTAVRPKPRHGVHEDLTHVAEVQDSDLIVMGGYGHSRLREWVFGGVTNAFLRDPPRAVLMSH